MKRVTGIGGIFFKSEDPGALKKWYNDHLHIDAGEHGAMFEWLQPDDPGKKGQTIWSPFPGSTEYFAPSDKPYMFNYRVKNLEKLLALLREEGVQVLGEIEEYPYGKFGWIMDPEGNKIELWEPVDEEEES